MSKKEPLEGLTVRIFDPPSATEDSSSKQSSTKKGSRGYREYTEQIGSEKLKYSVHKWDNTESSSDNSRKAKLCTEGLKESTKNWNAQPESKVQDLSLVSRVDADQAGISLRKVHLQHELYDHIKEKAVQVKDDDTLLEDTSRKKKWDPIVDLLRKLREGIYSSHWSDGDYDFAIEVYELSVDCCIKAERYEELYKSLNGLLNELYPRKQDARKDYYVVLDVIYHCCHSGNLRLALDRSLQLHQETNEGLFGRKLVKAVLTHNSLAYFRLYHYNPHLTFKILMRSYNDTISKKAIQIMRKSYLSTSIAWVGQWIGNSDGNAILGEMDRLVQPSCIKSVDYDKQIVHFLKNFK